jgi:multiple sugar transport system permease protein
LKAGVGSVTGKVRKKLRIIKYDEKKAILLLGPFIFWWLVVGAFPIFFGVALGFMEWKGLMFTPEFVGFDNFIYFFRNPTYYNSLFRAIWMGGLCMVLTMAISFGAALAINGVTKLKGIFRTLWYIPSVTSVAAISQIFLILIDPEFGAVNHILAAVDLNPINVNESFASAVVVIIFYSVWKGIGGNMLLWLAGLQSIDKALYEAAAIDGANGTRKFLHITMPGMKPFITYAVITGAIGALQIYEQIAFLTAGGPLGRTETSVFLIMRDAFYNFNFGMAGASSVLITVIVFVFALFYLKGQREKVSKAGFVK